jgi:hypothetical protein
LFDIHLYSTATGAASTAAATDTTTGSGATATDPAEFCGRTESTVEYANNASGAAAGRAGKSRYSIADTEQSAGYFTGAAAVSTCREPALDTAESVAIESGSAYIERCQ